MRTFLFLILWTTCLGSTGRAELIFQGVDSRQITETRNGFPVVLHVIDVDLRDPGIHFQVTEQSGPMETTLETTAHFVDRIGAQVGINANFYNPADGPAGTPADVVSVAASLGNAFSPFLSAAWPGLNIGADNKVTFIDPKVGDTTGYHTAQGVSLYNAVAGNYRLVANGQAITTGDLDFQPRTAIGLTQDGNHLLLVTVDGRSLTHSVGLTIPDLAAEMKALGAYNALNLDGGFSSSLVVADPTARLINEPIDRNGNPGERAVGLNLGIFARPVPEPSSLALMTIAIGSFVTLADCKRKTMRDMGSGLEDQKIANS